MNKIQQILKEREGLFDKEFVEERTPIENTKGEFTCKVIASAKNIKSFHATTISLLLNSLKEEIDWMRDDSSFFARKDPQMNGYQGALSDISTLLSETIRNIQTK